jgi:S1-C subfamily serine protease
MLPTHPRPHWPQQSLLLCLVVLLSLLAIPAPLAAAPCNYVTRRGDTLATIAARNGITVRAIMQANPQITNPNVIRSGQQLRLPNCVGTGSIIVVPATATPGPSATPAPTTGTPTSSPGLLVPIREPRQLPAPPPDLAPELAKRIHDATLNLRHPVDSPRYSGSGTIIGPDGRTFITAYHVIGNALTGEQVSQVSIGPFADWRFTADLVAADAGIDSAILRITAPDFPGFAVAPLGSSTALQEGEPIYTFSYPGSAGSLVTGKGHYLTRVRSFHSRAPLIVTDASANYGSSGGVAVNQRGEVIGLIVGGILGRPSMVALGYPDLNQATLIVPIDEALELFKQAGVK